MALLEVAGIGKSFGSTAVLRDISFTLEVGEAIAIIGSSGSGKTTLLRCLNFLETADTGSITVGGETLWSAADAHTRSEADIRKKRLHFGLVFQNFNLFPQYTALQNVMLAEQLLAKERPDYKQHKKEIFAEIEEHARQLLADPFFLAGVQEYTGLEPMKRIHWTATAREGRLMVFQNQYTARKNLTIFLNTQSRPGFSSPTGDDPQLEDCIRFCAYLFRVAADSDTPFRFLSNGVDSESKKPVVTAESWGEGFALEQSRVLARLTAAHQSPLDAFLQQQDPLLSSDELIFISTYFDEVIQSFARQRARAGAHVTVFVRGTVLPSDLDPGVYDIYALQGTARQQKEGDPQ